MQLLLANSVSCALLGEFTSKSARENAQKAHPGSCRIGGAYIAGQQDDEYMVCASASLQHKCKVGVLHACPEVHLPELWRGRDAEEQRPRPQ